MMANMTSHLKQFITFSQGSLKKKYVNDLNKTKTCILNYYFRLIY